MDHRIPKTGVVVCVVMGVAALITFIYLNLAFEGPSFIRGLVGEGYVVETKIADTEAIPTKQPVLIRGLEVGKVKGTSYDRESQTATIEFSIADEYAPLYRDATVAVGERTILGDSYLRLDPGTETAGELPEGGEVRSLESVDFDEALAFLDKKGRRHTKAILDELADATRSTQGAQRLNDTGGELARALGELRLLTETLRGQEADLAGLVSDGATVLGELGRREAALRAIVGSGRSTLDALAANTASLDAGLAELPPLLDAGRRVLANSRPLLEEAGPLVRELREAAPELTPIFDDLPSVTADTVDIVSDLSGIPALRKTLEMVNLIGPSVPQIEAATRNLVTLLGYTAPRARSIGAFFANFAGALARGDSVGRWARFAILFEPGELSDQPTPATCRPEDDVAPNAGFCHNAYPGPSDPLDNEPYERGSYPRLEPFDPPTSGD
jgi:phospholipid/cholesterol/gamma-HCH transport system substrate-binding protein